MIYLLAAIVFFGSLIGYRKTPSYEKLARLLFRLGMVAGVAIAVLAYVMFNVVIIGGKEGG